MPKYFKRKFGFPPVEIMHGHLLPPTTPCTEHRAQHSSMWSWCVCCEPYSHEWRQKNWMICLGLSICGICLLLDGKTGWEGRERGEGVGLDLLSCVKYIYLSEHRSAQSRLGLGVWFFLRVEEVPGSIPGADPFWETFLGVSHAHHPWTYQVVVASLNLIASPSEK